LSSFSDMIPSQIMELADSFDPEDWPKISSIQKIQKVLRRSSGSNISNLLSSEQQRQRVKRAKGFNDFGDIGNLLVYGGCMVPREKNRIISVGQ